MNGLQLGGYLDAIANSVTYYSNTDENNLPLAEPFTVAESNLFKHFYLQSAIGCKNYQNIQDCQVLANLCVLQLYNEQTIVCNLFQSIVVESTPLRNSTLAEFYGNDNNLKEEAPWLYYAQTPQKLLKDSEPIDMVVSFFTEVTDKSRVKELTYYLARYNINGTFEGFQELKT